MASAATPALAALRAAGVPHRVLRYHHDPRRRGFGAEAVAQLTGPDHPGILPDQVFKTLILAGPAGLAVAVLPVPARLSLKAAAAALGLAAVRLADPAEAQRATGYVTGGISPLGQRRSLPAVVDASALEFTEILCSAGRRGWDVALAPGDLVALTAAVTADIRTGQTPPRPAGGH
ncbi:YbaK/EbsC family protein [Mycolicibacillus trivialis]|uniref:Cys-tRNA(Pro)/Cys-tRNA(Cys) deacylase n=1 Tax=Mycolicibacillus trivialis TaxID=1798 RepID=A0A1X2EGT5_9MYCO|nr:YbaK/EbsC family protein [Mycolicibacillus trivialis]ORX01418.1 aminoacyl-tRNA deacylase [Mycolicibacillus trivialis]